MAEQCHFVHRFASTSTAIVATGRLSARSSALLGEYKRCKSLVRTIGCGVLPLVSGWRCVPVCRTSAELTSTCPSSKQRSAPRRPEWYSKVALNGPTRGKTARDWPMYTFSSFGWSSGPSRVDTGRVRSFACFFSTPFHTKRATFLVSGARCGACSARILGKLGAVPLQAQPRPSTCTRPGRSNHLRRSYTSLTPPGHLDVPKHSPPLTTQKAAAKRRCAQNEVQQRQSRSTKITPAPSHT